jgi:hypothetical protein
VADVAAGEVQQPWLVQSLWAAGAVGLIGGHPKAGKTWLALDLSLSVASGTPCLDTFPVHNPGPVLLFLAEDSPHSARTRIEGLATHRQLQLRTLDLFLITAPSLLLDRREDSDRLFATVDKLKPRLLVLDPLVRLHRSNENDAGEISALLSGLRLIQRTYGTAVILVHHARKNGRGVPGQDLRGSSDLHAWGDSYVYLVRRRDRLLLSLEQRFHRSIEPLSIHIASRPDGSCPHLALVDPKADPTPQPPTLQQLVLDTLASACPNPMPRTTLRARLRLNNLRLGEALQELERLGRARKTPRGWTLEPPSSTPSTLPLFRSANT